MRGRIDEATQLLTFDKFTEHRERERARAGMNDLSSVKRDVRNVRARMAARDRFLLDAQGSYMQTWDMLILLVMGWTVFVTPYEISFLPNADWSPIANLIVTSIFCVDIIKEFFLPYRLSHKEGGGKVKNHRAIAINYLRTWAAPDVLATTPIDLIVAAFTDPANAAASSAPLKAVRMVRLARLLRLGRLLRASRVMQRIIESLERYITISYTQREVAFWTIAMLVVFHWLSCLWGLLATMRETQRTPELELARLSAVPICDRGSGSCLSECEMELLADLVANSTSLESPLVSIQYQELWLCRGITDGILPPESAGQHGWYYSHILTDMTLSFGIGVYPRHHSEYVLAFFCAIINMVMNTFFLGVVATAMSQSDPIQRDFKARMDHLNHYLNEAEAPTELRFRTREYLKYTRDLVARRSFDDVYATFSPRLRADLHAHASMRTLLSVPFFRGCEEEFLRDLAPKLTHHGYEATETVVLSEATLCVVTRGTGVKGGKPITLNEYWGADFIVSSAALRDNRRASALTYMEIVCCSRSTLLESMEKFPVSAKKIRLAALHLAMIRAPLLIGRYFEMKLPDPHMEAAVRRGLTPNKRGFLGRALDAEGCSERSSVPSVTTHTPRAKEESTAMRHAFVRNQSVAFDVALRNLGKKSTTQQREFHGIMRAINGGAKLRGFARDQRYSEDPEMRAHACEALNVAGDEGRLILDEGGAVVGSNGQTIHVEKAEDENPAVVAVTELKAYLSQELTPMRNQIRSLQMMLGSAPLKFAESSAAHIRLPEAKTPSKDPSSVRPQDIASLGASGGKNPRRKQRLQGVPEPLEA